MIDRLGVWHGRAARCPRCFGMIRLGDVVVTHDGDSVHFACRAVDALR